MKALIVKGGWEGHDPEGIAEVFAGQLQGAGFQVEVAEQLEVFDDKAKLAEQSLIVPVWTMGKLTKEQFAHLNEAVRGGVGLAGVHGGMCDTFKTSFGYMWMTGGQFLGHPHIGEYTVRLTGQPSPITDPMPRHFTYKSEQYYMMVDPGNVILADTLYEHDGRRVIMPVVWTKTWGAGRVFYSALGHCAQEFADYPDVLAMTVRGFQWAAGVL